MSQGQHTGFVHVEWLQVCLQLLFCQACHMLGLWLSDYKETGHQDLKILGFEMSSMVPGLSWGLTSFKASWLQCALGHAGLSGASAAGASTELGFRPQLRMS